jgi:hypothetical protein
MVASDGELYGHHQAFRDWFLAYLVNGAGAKVGIRLTYPALWLRDHPPTQETRIREYTSWSCHHGVERWRGDCDCLPEPGHWKQTLRNTLDRLSVQLDQIYETEICALDLDPWHLRKKYIQVMLGNNSLEALVDRPLTTDELSKVVLLLEAQRERQRMYTSCGFFFENFDRIEPQNNVAYARHAVTLTEQATGVDLSLGSQWGEDRIKLND